MAAHDLTFGVFVPQGWKMELASHRRPAGEVGEGGRDRRCSPRSSGYDSLWVYDHFHNVPVPAHETMFECWTDDGGDQPAHEPDPARPDGRLRAVPQPGAAGEDHVEHRRDRRRAPRLGRSAPGGTSTSSRATATSSRSRAGPHPHAARDRRDREGDVVRARRHLRRAALPARRRAVRPEAGAEAAPADLDRRRWRAAHAARRRPPRRRARTSAASPHECAAQVRRAQAALQGRSAATTTRSGRRSRRRCSSGRPSRRSSTPALVRSGASRSSRGGRATSSARPSRSPRRCRRTSTSAAPASTRGAATTPSTETMRLFAQVADHLR